MTPSPAGRHRLFMQAAVAACAIGLIGASAAPARKPAKDDGRVAVGEAVDCISTNRIRNSRVLDDRTIDFEMDGGVVYRNVLPFSCSGLGFEQRFSYRLSTPQLCSVDIITVLRTGGPGLMPGPSCGLGKFQKMSKPVKPAK